MSRHRKETICKCGCGKLTGNKVRGYCPGHYKGSPGAMRAGAATSKRLLGTTRPAEFGRQVSEKMTEYWSHSENVKSQSVRLRKLWKTEEYANHVVSAMSKALGGLKGMTSAENKMQVILDELCLAYWFTGQGDHVIGKKFCPDFTHLHFKWVIEVYGDYFHNLPKVRQRDRRRKRAMKQAGYKLLVIHEKELKDPDGVKAKIKKFHSRNLGKSF